MKNEELKLKIQALVDNELPESEIGTVMSHIEGSYEMRDEYVELLKLKRRLEGVPIDEPPAEWYDAAARKASRRLGSTIGIGLFIGSYLMLLVYAVTALFSSGEADIWIKIVVAAAIVGFVVLLVVTIGDRIRESRTDRYKEVIR